MRWIWEQLQRFVHRPQCLSYVFNLDFNIYLSRFANDMP